MAQNLLDDLLAEMQGQLRRRDLLVAEMQSLLKQAESERAEYAGIVKGVEMAIKALADEPAMG